jgi:electron transport complex protein RnfG
MKIGPIIKLGLILMVYAAAACVGLAFVYSATQKTIAERTQADLEAALKELFPDADSFEDVTGKFSSPAAGITLESEYAVMQGGKTIGAAVRAAGGSYGGAMKILVGVNGPQSANPGTISRIKVMEHSDTPGLGANAASPAYFVNKEKGITFAGQFDNKNVSDRFEPKDDVIAITAATITSRAVSNIVKAAGQAAEQWLQGAGK